MARLVQRSVLFMRIWWWFTIVTILLRLRPLPLVIQQLSVQRAGRSAVLSGPLAHAVSRSLSVLGYEPRCLTASLVLYRLLREQGAEPELVIGLPREPRDEKAHAWIEVGGREVGPPPGRQGHVELARYGGAAPVDVPHA